MAHEYTLEKQIWRTQDFERMNWHDATVHAVAFAKESYELLLDIDYVLKWVEPRPEEGQYRFWVAPATLVFENVSELRIDLYGNLTWSIDEIRRENLDVLTSMRQRQYSWTLDCEAGDISLRSTGFAQAFRTRPRLVRRPFLDVKERGGLSFDRPTPE
jgi:hypothetical protein